MGTGTGIGRVRGLGSAKAGAHHWWLQRVTAAGNILLLAWFVISLLRLPSLDHDTVVRWIQSPLTVVPLVLLIANVFWHFRLGLQVAIEDYVHGGGRIRSEEHTSELQSLMSISYAVFCLNKKTYHEHN